MLALTGPDMLQCAEEMLQSCPPDTTVFIQTKDVIKERRVWELRMNTYLEGRCFSGYPSLQNVSTHLAWPGEEQARGLGAPLGEGPGPGPH